MRKEISFTKRFVLTAAIIAAMAILPFCCYAPAVAYAGGELSFSQEETVDGAILTAATVYTVQAGDSMWKIAVKYEVGLQELITANPQIKNPALIYVGQKINIPQGAPLKSIEDEVVRLINIERGKNGLGPLTSNWQAARVARIK